MVKRDSSFIANVAYIHKTSPAERFIAILKAQYKKLRLTSIVRNEEVNTRLLVTRAVYIVEQITKICDLGKRILLKNTLVDALNVMRIG